MKPYHLIVGTYRKEPFSHETTLSKASFDETVEIIARSDYTGSSPRVIEIDEAAGTVRDVSMAVAAAVGQLSIERQDAPMSDTRAFLDAHGVRYYEEPDESVFEMSPHGYRRRAA